MIGMVSYYRASLAIPLLAPPVAYFVGVRGGALSPGTAGILWLSLLIGGLPYFVLAALMFFWVRGQTERRVHFVIYMSPFFMILLLGLAVAAFFMLRGEAGVDHGLVDAIAGHTIFALVLGYLYVAVVQLVYLSLKAMKVIAVPDQRE